MNEITPENVQEKLNLFQQIQQQVQSLSQQISQIDMSIGETERTLEEIKDLGKKATTKKGAFKQLLKAMGYTDALVNDIVAKYKFN